MEFTNEISFNQKLTKNEPAKITYNGFLAKEGSNSVSIVYGFGENWDETQEKAMQKIESGFEAEVKMLPYSTFNFCFRNENNIWDNNYSFNFISPIEDKQESTEEIPEEAPAIETLIEEVQISQEPQVDNIEEIETISEEAPIEGNIQEIETISEEIPAEENIQEIETIAEEAPAEENIQEIETISEEAPAEDNIQEIETISEEAPAEDNIQDIEALPEEDQNEQIQKIEAEISALFDELFETNEEESNIQQISAEEINSGNVLAATPIEEDFDLDKLIEEILAPTPTENISPITESEPESPINNFDFIEFKDVEKISDKPIQEETNKEVVEEKTAELPVLKDTKHGLVVSSRKLNRFNFAIKKIKLSLYKALVAIPKFFQSQFGSSKD